MWLLTLFLTSRTMQRTTELWPIMSHFAVIMLRRVHTQMQWKCLQTCWTIIEIVCLQFWTQLELLFGIQKVIEWEKHMHWP
ncbi:hypothetical protein BC830DRAFT_1114950 [Chytriomyces sp. MP71]|nr:hypothetical protein BC830DRAFT_1114950 [Chytriomyces sp. MP71]